MRLNDQYHFLNIITELFDSAKIDEGIFFSVLQDLLDYSIDLCDLLVKVLNPLEKYIASQLKLKLQ